MIRFTPTETFECPEMRSVYVGGMSYTVRTADLFDKVREWKAAGKVRILPEGQPGTAPSAIAGTGTVS